MEKARRFVVYSSSRGNSFFDEIRDLLACGLRDLDLDVQVRDERRGFDSGSDWHLVVAPHEFFSLAKGIALRKIALPGRLLFFCAEQPRDRYFAIASRYFPAASEIWHLDRRSASLILRKGFRARHVPLGFSPRFKLFPDDPKPLAERSIDVFFAGTLTPRRRAFLRRHADVWARYSVKLRLAGKGPIRPGRPGCADAATLVREEGLAKIVLNLHRGDEKFFEWHRIVAHGIAQGALVISEPTGGAPPFVAGRDFVERPLDQIPEAIDYFMRSSAGRARAQRIVANGLDTFRRVRLADSLVPAVRALPLNEKGCRVLGWAGVDSRLNRAQKTAAALAINF